MGMGYQSRSRKVVNWVPDEQQDGEEMWKASDKLADPKEEKRSQGSLDLGSCDRGSILNRQPPGH